jgi:hypothetical protein
MKEEKTLKILELIKDGVETASVLIEAFLSAGYGASMRDMDRAIDKALSRRAQESQEREERQRFYNLVYRLKRDGLIENKHLGEIRLTTKGEGLLVKLRLKSKNSLPPPKYKKESGGKNENRVTVVAFDVPEKERQKRHWLVSALKNLDFNLVQKSVWIGKTKIPKEFLKNLNDLRMVSYVEIFEITKTGSLKQIS